MSDQTNAALVSIGTKLPSFQEKNNLYSNFIFYQLYFIYFAIQISYVTYLSPPLNPPQSSPLSFNLCVRLCFVQTLNLLIIIHGG